jgi:branched-chain amino acid transport system permease protein
MIGGVGTIIGPALGGLVLIPLSEVMKVTLEQQLGQKFIGVHFIIYGIILMTIVVKMPQGVYPYIKRKLLQRFFVE